MSYGGGIFDSAPNNEEISSIEQVIAATANMDTWDNHASTGYAGGRGTYSDPYRIETAGQLAYLAKQSRMTTLTGCYSLENSVDMSEYLWLGIGSSSYPFMGGITVEGDYKYISTCAVLDVKFITNSTDYSYICPISYWNDYNCYAKTICINNNAGVRRSSKVLSSNFTTNSTGISSFFYDSGLNKGYPIPKSLIRVGTATKQTHTQVYNYLVGLGFSK